MEELINKYFPQTSAPEKERLLALQDLYQYWNERINVISRKDMDNFFVHHLLHSLAIAKIVSFPNGSKILDIGTGGGFPGIPLAIMFPESQFLLCDSIGKKIRVVNEIIAATGIKNATGVQIRAEELPGKFDFAVTRAVAKLGELLPWVWEKTLEGEIYGIKRGIYALKGGDLSEEISAIPHKFLGKQVKPVVTEISKLYEEDYFKEKRVIFVAR